VRVLFGRLQVVLGQMVELKGATVNSRLGENRELVVLSRQLELGELRSKDFCHREVRSLLKAEGVRFVHTEKGQRIHAQPLGIWATAIQEYSALNFEVHASYFLKEKSAGPRE
jgi:hypothetical protein